MKNKFCFTPKEAADRLQEKIAGASASLTYQDYDDALEGYLKEVRCARGYTLREPQDWVASSVPRWKADAADWVAFRDKVMLFGLEVENQYIQTGKPPMTLQEFKDKLREFQIEWTWKDDDREMLSND